jgi:NAD(P)H dehydrogenase (quinone)
VHALASALADGAFTAGAEVRLRRVAETAPRPAVEANPRWREHAETVMPEIEVAHLADLEWANGYAFGTPTRFGLPSAQLKAFLDTSGALWAQGRLADKVATSFTAASTPHGGLEATLLALNNTFYHWGSLVMPLGYGDAHLMKESGNPYGASFTGGSKDIPTEVELLAARKQGHRLARFAAAIAKASPAGDSMR